MKNYTANIIRSDETLHFSASILGLQSLKQAATRKVRYKRNKIQRFKMKHANLCFDSLARSRKGRPQPTKAVDGHIHPLPGYKSECCRLPWMHKVQIDSAKFLFVFKRNLSLISVLCSQILSFRIRLQIQTQRHHDLSTRSYKQIFSSLGTMPTWKRSISNQQL